MVHKLRSTKMTKKVRKCPKHPIMTSEMSNETCPLTMDPRTFCLRRIEIYLSTYHDAVVQGSLPSTMIKLSLSFYKMSH